MKCEAPKCRNRATYVSPGNWCQKHWSMWWKYTNDNHANEPEWMRNPKSRKSEGKKL